MFPEKLLAGLPLETRREMIPMWKGVRKINVLGSLVLLQSDFYPVCGILTALLGKRQQGEGGHRHQA